MDGYPVNPFRDCRFPLLKVELVLSPTMAAKDTVCASIDPNLAGRLHYKLQKSKRQVFELPGI